MVLDTRSGIEDTSKSRESPSYVHRTAISDLDVSGTPDKVLGIERPPASGGEESKLSIEVAIVGIFSALCLAVGYALVFVPNVELFTMMVFLSGFLFGVYVGASVGSISSMLFAYLNPLGASHLLLYLTQVSLYTLLGAVAGFIRGKSPLDEVEMDGKHIFKFVVTGIVFVLVFDVATTVAQYLPFVGLNASALWAYLVFGAGFTAIHLISNAFSFGCLVPVIVAAVKPLKIPYFN
ncbi:MAG: hypothetical protein ACTSU5_15265 [Promethearchaeota archaeon]